MYACVCFQVACGSCHMLVLATPRTPENQEVVLVEDSDDGIEDRLENLVEVSYNHLLLTEVSFSPAPPTVPACSNPSARARRRNRVRLINSHR